MHVTDPGRRVSWGFCGLFACYCTGCLRLGGTVESFRGMDICRLLGLRARFKVMPYISTTDISLNNISFVNGSYYLIED